MKDKFEIVVSGAAQISHCCKNIRKLSKELGREIARQNCNLVTGATTGVPYLAAQGCKEVGGFNIGFSPAVSEAAHLKKYRLPLDVFDVIIYTGADYAGRNLMMTKSADGVIILKPKSLIDQENYVTLSKKGKKMIDEALDAERSGEVIGPFTDIKEALKALKES